MMTLKKVGQADLELLIKTLFYCFDPLNLLTPLGLSLLKFQCQF